MGVGKGVENPHHEIGGSVNLYSESESFFKQSTPDTVFKNFIFIFNQFVYKVFLKRQVRNDTLKHSN